MARRHQNVDLLGVDIHLDDVGLVGGGGGDVHRVVAARPQRVDHRVRQVEGAHPAEVGLPHRQSLEPALRVREHDPAVTQERIARLAEHPLRIADVRDRGRRRSCAPRPASTGTGSRTRAVAEEPEGAVGRPRRLADRLPLVGAGHHRAAPAFVDDEPRRVPGHVGVVPLEPAERLAVGAPARIRDEVRSLDDRLWRAGCVGGEAHDRVGGLAAVGMVLLLDAQERGAVGVQVTVGVAQAAHHLGFRRERNRRPARLHAVEPLRRPVGEPQHAVVHPPGPTAVLVHGAAGAVVRRAAPRRPSHPDDVAAPPSVHPPRDGPPTTTRRPRRRAGRWAGAPSAPPARS